MAIDPGVMWIVFSGWEEAIRQLHGHNYVPRHSQQLSAQSEPQPTMAELQAQGAYLAALRNTTPEDRAQLLRLFPRPLIQVGPLDV